MKEQIGISVTVIPGDLQNKEMMFPNILVTLKHLDVMIADYVGTLQDRDGDVEQTEVSILTQLKRSFFKQVRMKYF